VTEDQEPPEGDDWDRFADDPPEPDHYTELTPLHVYDNEWDRLEGSWAGTPPAANGHHETEGVFVEWADFWKRDRSEADYLLDDVIVRGRGHAVYAPHKAGKSLFTLWACVEILKRNPKAVVIYLDYEMTEDDLQERLEDMGYGADSDLERLRYWLLPTLPPLNSAHGSEALLAIVGNVALAFPDHHIAVVIDTTSRAVSGEENESGPYRDFYRLTGLRLKQLGVTWVRLDHEGKDPTKDQRGSSAKGDDIDVAWQVKPTDDGIALTRKLTRISWVPERVVYSMPADPLRYVRVGETVPAGTKECVDLLDAAGVPVDMSGNAAQAALKEAGTPKRRNVVHAAQKARKRRDTEGAR
jgi:hypothetical protein